MYISDHQTNWTWLKEQDYSVIKVAQDKSRFWQGKQLKSTWNNYSFLWCHFFLVHGKNWTKVYRRHHDMFLSKKKEIIEN